MRGFGAEVGRDQRFLDVVERRRVERRAAGEAGEIVRDPLGGLGKAARYGKGKVMTGEQVRWGLENLALDQKRLDALGFAGVLRPISTSCADHMGSTWARIQTWDGTKWGFTTDFMQADEQIIKPMVKTGAEKYLSDKKMERRSVADCQS